MSSKIELKKMLPVSAEMVFDAWLDPESIKQWMCPMPGVTVPNPIIDPRVGGQFKFDMEVGENVMPHIGEYKVLDRPNKIQFTWNSVNTNNADSLVTVYIEPSGDKACELTLLHELLPSEESVKNHTTGWTNIFDCLEKSCTK